MKVKEAKKEKKLIFAIDMDGTIVENTWPEVGADLPMAELTIRALAAKGHHLILWTCRTGVHLERAVSWFKDKGIKVVINDDTWQTKRWMGPGNRKIFADVYLDDRSFPPFPGWQAVWDKYIEPK